MRPLRHILSGETALAGLLDRRRRELAVLDRLQHCLPPALAAQADVADASPPELVLLAAGGAAATLLRHRAPELLEALAREGWKFTGIRVRVQARPGPKPQKKTPKKQLDAASARVLLAGADALADPRLASALRRLAARGDDASEAEQQSIQGVEDQHPKQEQ